MSQPSYMGLTWDHPRGYRALDAAAALAGEQGLSIRWDRQPLEGFESRPIAELAALYDLLVLDHPHLGDALDADCLVPLDEVLGAEVIGEIVKATIGPCAESYRLDGKLWALPLDAATQVMAYRPDLLEGEPPATWDAVATLAERGGVALSLAGPHALLTLMSISAAIGAPADDDALFEPAYGAEAYGILASFYANAVYAALPLNPVGLLDHMAINNDITLCPLVFGYVNYTAPQHGRPIAFANAPATAAGGRRPGSVLGGTGIGITKRCQVTPDLVTHLAWLLGAEAQTRFIPNHKGQPSRRDAWADGAVNAAWPNFYAATARTLESAYVRPRLQGFVPLQLEAAATIRAALAERSSGPALIDRLNRLYRRLKSSSEGFTP
ncbi:multiple sugar transport system substrate-binding protein [Devosia sp. UYZn731]|uniref:extracellular solute-binding protein n=1 Tax=Devosia sp. UYZn731 TaxID=3156345 RepID=UPI00339B915B